MSRTTAQLQREVLEEASQLNQGGRVTLKWTEEIMK